MKPNEYKELENNKLFKRYYMGKTMWWKSFLIFAPACLIFIGLAGIMQMGYNDKLWTLHAAPYIIVFALGAIWLKGIKNHLQGKILDNKRMYLACAAQSVGTLEGRYFYIFTIDSKRHNEQLIAKTAESFDIDLLTKDDIKAAKKGVYEIPTSDESDDTVFYIKGIDISTAKRANRDCLKGGIIPLLYVSKKDVFVIRNKDLPK